MVKRSTKLSLNMSDLTQHPSWKSLQAHHSAIAKKNLRELFGADPMRGEKMAMEAVGIVFDYSKNLITDETLRLLTALAEEAGLRGRIDAMFAGEKINTTENRAVLHVALRAPKEAVIE